jgi:hypothetical protein
VLLQLSRGLVAHYMLHRKLLQRQRLCSAHSGMGPAGGSGISVDLGALHGPIHRCLEARELRHLLLRDGEDHVERGLHLLAHLSSSPNESIGSDGSASAFHSRQQPTQP